MSNEMDDKPRRFGIGWEKTAKGKVADGGLRQEIGWDKK